jgi:hypothetical protein
VAGDRALGFHQTTMILKTRRDDEQRPPAAALSLVVRLGHPSLLAFSQLAAMRSHVSPFDSVIERVFRHMICAPIGDRKTAFHDE